MSTVTRIVSHQLSLGQLNAEGLDKRTWVRSMSHRMMRRWLGLVTDRPSEAWLGDLACLGSRRPRVSVATISFRAPFSQFGGPQGLWAVSRSINYPRPVPPNSTLARSSATRTKKFRWSSICTEYGVGQLSFEFSIHSLLGSVASRLGRFDDVCRLYVSRLPHSRLPLKVVLVLPISRRSRPCPCAALWSVWSFSCNPDTPGCVRFVRQFGRAHHHRHKAFHHMMAI